jgi:RimJ/RimL family protein N-acetyltransferase
MPLMQFSPLVLEGRHLRLKPLEGGDVPALFAASEASLWEWNPQHHVQSLGDMETVVSQALQGVARGDRLAMVLQDSASGEVIGSSSFLNPDAANGHVEIGSTWIAPAFQQTYANPEAKFLMLSHAFEAWGCSRVEFKTDSLNARSRAALLKLGATEEGTFRNHIRTHTGRMRHSVYFSVTDEEWPAMKASLLARLARFEGKSPQ